MFVRFDKNKMELQVLCGILENYKPSKDIKEIHKRVASLKDKMEAFMKATVEKELAEIDALIKVQNEKFIVPPEPPTPKS